MLAVNTHDSSAARETSSAASTARPPRRTAHCFPLQPRIDGFALQREHAEGAFMHAAQRLAPDEALQPLDAERELAQRERELAAEPALPQALDMLRHRVVRPVDDAQIFEAAALQRRLHQALRSFGDEVE